jgi:hypothetical protein
MRGDDCYSNSVWEFASSASERVQPWESRIEHRIVLTLTADGAASGAAEELRTGLQFWFLVGPASEGVRVRDVGLLRADGSELVIDAYATEGDGYRIYSEGMLSDCVGECVREFLAWAEVTGEGFASYSGSLAIPNDTCGEHATWLHVEVERIWPSP